MRRPFIYGMSVEGENFTDRVKETKRLKLNFENGLNTVLISPRRMGKTSLVKKVCKEVDAPDVKVIYMDIYDCRSEYDFYNKFAAQVLKETANTLDYIMENAKEFLVRISPKLAFSPEPNSEYSLSLGITPKTHKPEEVLNLPEQIAQKRGIHIVVCIDEFQQVGEFPESLTVQKRLRSVWQHQKNTSYCLFGSKKHLMANLFQDKRMPFYQFGEMIFLERIPTDDWVEYICRQFSSKGKSISVELARDICNIVENYSSYVQQLAWNVFAETDEVATEENYRVAVNELLMQSSALFMQQIEGLSTYQMNFVRAVCAGVEGDFGSSKVTEDFDFGSKSNINRIKTTLVNKEILDNDNGRVRIADPVFKLWFRRNYF